MKRGTRMSGVTVEFFGETHAVNDQEYGALNAQGVFSSIVACEWASGASQCSNPATTGRLSHQNDSYSGFYVQSSTSFDIGDNKCST
jgi:hypothetical protein